MCASFLATPYVTGSGSFVYAKNSYREPNEAQSVIRIPSKEHFASHTPTTHITIPQVPETFGMILCKPFHSWGAEMGINEYGVVVGNEVIKTRVSFNRDNKGLTGLDIVRLTLERSTSAEDALEQLTYFIEQFGQDSYAGYQRRNAYYHNSFIILDAHEAFLVETAGREWVAKSVKGFYALTNHLTIKDKYEYSSDTLIEYARSKGWIGLKQKFSFEKIYSPKWHPGVSISKRRRQWLFDEAKKYEQKLDISKAILLLKGKDVNRDRYDPASDGPFAVSLQADGLLSRWQTTGSMIVELRPDERPNIWVTGTSAPELSIFKPIYLDGTALMKNEWQEPGPQADETLWWKHEKLYRMVLKNYTEGYSIIREEIMENQDEWLRDVKKFTNNYTTEEEFDHITYFYQRKHRELIQQWTDTILQANLPSSKFHPFYKWYWEKLNKAASISL